MEKRARTRLIVAGIAAAVLFVGALAWWESRFPLKYLDADRVHMARAEAVRGGRERELTGEERAELCELLNGAPRIESFEGRRSVTVELVTADYGRVNVYDLGGPGANLLINAGRKGEETCTVRSGKLGDFLARLAGELGVEEGEKAGEPPASGG